jgi:hypothetical protein
MELASMLSGERFRDCPAAVGRVLRAPDRIAGHVILSIRRPTDGTHAAVLSLFDQLIACAHDVVRPQTSIVVAEPAVDFA